ncbi:hypothetical protein BDV23DRAFT_173374 [Aspergillus alliaceus]|uniref:feruloyl esterase n=1 Tax=Petromyces alliaceus TaxID=209559 RepID=A0A5N7C4M9_PETAA|nr:hypothetical protein BDV23DRAFT_173374 [Aspergillus alliaceus]
MKVLLIACLLAALRPLETHSRINCAGLPGLQKNQAARILQAHEVSIGSLTLSKAVGNSDYTGIIDNATMLTDLSSGFVVAGCDSGPSLSSSQKDKPNCSVPFLNDIAKVKAWISDSIAITTNVTRDITTRYYAERPAYALAKYHPFLFDGMYAGCAGNSGNEFINQDTLDFIADRTIEACDKIDGVRKILQYKPGQTAVSVDKTRCLTPVQIQSACSKDEDYNVKVFIWGSDINLLDQIALPLIDEISPDLTALKQRGGKMVMLQGWADQYNAASRLVPGCQNIQYFYFN